MLHDAHCLAAVSEPTLAGPLSYAIELDIYAVLDPNLCTVYVLVFSLPSGQSYVSLNSPQLCTRHPKHPRVLNLTKISSRHPCAAGHLP
jgi:hypothetical protein